MWTKGTSLPPLLLAVPFLTQLDRQIAWGTDDESMKGGDFFKTKPTPKL